MSVCLFNNQAILTAVSPFCTLFSTRTDCQTSPGINASPPRLHFCDLNNIPAQP